MPENLPKLMKDMNLHIQEGYQTPNKVNVKIFRARYNQTFERQRNLKAAKGKQFFTHKGSSVRLSTDISSENLEARRQWANIFKVLKEKNYQPRILYQ